MVTVRPLALVLFTAVIACGGAEGRPALTAADLDAYLSIVDDVRRERRTARLDGKHVTEWEAEPGVADALSRIGWTMKDYLRVEGQVAAARLRIEAPDLFDKEFVPADAPRSHVEIVRQRLAEVQRAQAPFE